MNILLISGHCATRVGASGNGYKEHELTIKGVKAIKERFKEYDVTVDLYDEKRDAFVDAQQGKLQLPKKYDYAFELHFNAHSNNTAHGTECYVTHKEKGIAVEQGVMKHMGKYFTLRDNDSVKDGVKRSDFLVIKTLGDKGISGCLLEVCFISNKANMETFAKNEKAIYNGIADAIASGFGIKKKVVTPAPTPTPPATTTDEYVGKTVTLKGYLYANSNGGGKKNTSVKTGKITKKHTSGSTPYLIGNGTGWVGAKDFTVGTTTTAPKMRVGATVTYSGYVYSNSNGGGRGNKVNGTYKVTIYNSHPYGAHIASLGWVKPSACKVIG